MSRDELMRHPWIGLRPFLRHSLVLSVSGFIFVMIGVSYLSAEPTAQRVLALKYAVNILDYQNWGWVWIGCGILAIISSRWPPISETWGYVVLTGLSAGWGAFYWAAVMFGGAPESNLSAVFSWGLIAFLWWAISGLVNPGAIVKLSAQILELQHENIRLMEELREIHDRER